MISLLADNRSVQKKTNRDAKERRGLGRYGMESAGRVPFPAVFFWGGGGLRQNAGFASLSTGCATVSFLFAGVVGAGEAVVGGRCGWVFPFPFSKEKRNVGLFAGGLRFFSL